MTTSASTKRYIGCKNARSITARISGNATGAVHLHNAPEPQGGNLVPLNPQTLRSPRELPERCCRGIGEIENSDTVKGYEVDHDTYVLREPEEIDAIKLESKRTLDLVQFVDAKQVAFAAMDIHSTCTTKGLAATELRRRRGLGSN